jgi:membrane protein implicated in regulation of membrane protease activity
MIEYFWMASAGAIAYLHGRGSIRWILAAYLFSWLAVIVVLLLPKKTEKMQEREEGMKDLAERVAVKQEFKDINTVDDLMKQLETPKG